MRILIVSDYFYPHWTGISKSLYYLIKANIKELQFDVLTTKYKKELKNQEKIFQTTIYRESYIFSMSRVKYSVLVILKFIKLIGNYDGILINSPCSNILPISLLTKIFNKKLYIFHQGDLVLPYGKMNRIIEKIFDIYAYIAFFIANKISTYSTDYGLYSRNIKPFLSKFNPLLMPVVIDKKCVEKNNAIYKKLLNLKRQKKILFGFAGRFVEEKGFDILLNSIPEIIKQNSNIQFVFAGDTKIVYENFYEKNRLSISLAKKNLTILGLLNETDLQNFYHLIDFIVIPSRSDCFNLVQAEAMLFGKPSIVSDIPGARYLVRKTGFGTIFKRNSPVDLKTEILLIVKNRAKINNNYPNVVDVLDQIKIENKICEFFGT